MTDWMFFYVDTEDGVKVYDYYNNDRGANESSFYQRRLVTIKFVNSSGNEIESYYSLKAVKYEYDEEYSSTHSLFFPEEDSQYIYTYKLGDGTSVTRDTMITEDMVIYVTTVEKGKIKVTIDDSNYTVDFSINGAKKGSVASNLQWTWGGLDGDVAYYSGKSFQIVNGIKVFTKLFSQEHVLTKLLNAVQS